MPEAAPLANNLNPDVINRDPIEVVIFLCTSTPSLPLSRAPPFVLSLTCPLIEILNPPLVKIAGQLFQIIALFIVISQTPTIVVVLGCFVFLFGVLEGGVSFWRVPLRFLR
jgi:hypothetical protein